MRANLDRICSVRITQDDAERVEEVARRAAGLRRGDVLRRALLKGLALVEAELETPEGEGTSR